MLRVELIVTKPTTGTEQIIAHSGTIIIRLRSFGSVLNDQSLVNTEYQVFHSKTPKMSFFFRIFRLQYNISFLRMKYSAFLQDTVNINCSIYVTNNIQMWNKCQWQFCNNENHHSVLCKSSHKKNTQIICLHLCQLCVPSFRESIWNYSRYLLPHLFDSETPKNQPTNFTVTPIHSQGLAEFSSG